MEVDALDQFEPAARLVAASWDPGALVVLAGREGLNCHS